ncbi:unnamed protein product [Parajaminaea phylloscopi]
MDLLEPMEDLGPGQATLRTNVGDTLLESSYPSENHVASWTDKSGRRIIRIISTSHSSDSHARIDGSQDPRRGLRLSSTSCTL